MYSESRALLPKKKFSYGSTAGAEEKRNVDFFSACLADQNRSEMIKMWNTVGMNAKLNLFHKHLESQKYQSSDSRSYWLEQLMQQYDLTILFVHSAVNDIAVAALLFIFLDRYLRALFLSESKNQESQLSEVVSSTPRRKHHLCCLMVNWPHLYQTPMEGYHALCQSIVSDRSFQSARLGDEFEIMRCFAREMSFFISLLPKNSVFTDDLDCFFNHAMVKSWLLLSSSYEEILPWEKIYPEYHTAVLSLVLNNLGCLYASLRKTRDAERYFSSSYSLGLSLARKNKRVFSRVRVAEPVRLKYHMVRPSPNYILTIQASSQPRRGCMLL